MKTIGMFISFNRRSLLSLGFVFGLAALGIYTGQTSANNAASSITPTSTNVTGRTMRVVSTNAAPGSQVTVSIELDSQNDEVAASFTLNFDAAKLSNPIVTLGSGAPTGAALGVNANEAGTGKLGILVDSSDSFIFSPPARQVIAVTFAVAANAPAGATPITFVTTPTPLSVSNPNGSLLQTVYEVGTVTISEPVATAVTVSGRVTTPSGQSLRNAVVSIVDSNNVRRNATTSSFGLFTFSNVMTNQMYTVLVSSKRYRFTPQIISVTDNITNLNFTGLE